MKKIYLKPSTEARTIETATTLMATSGDKVVNSVQSEDGFTYGGGSTEAARVKASHDVWDDDWSK